MIENCFVLEFVVFAVMREFEMVYFLLKMITVELEHKIRAAREANVRNALKMTGEIYQQNPDIAEFVKEIRLLMSYGCGEEMAISIVLEAENVAAVESIGRQ